MKELDFLHFKPGRSIWHRHDPRLKLLEIILWSIMALAARPFVMGCIAMIIMILLGVSGVGIKRMRKPLLFWVIMATAIIISAGLSDKSIPLIVNGIVLPLGKSGLISGSLRAARLLTVLLAGQLLTATTDPADLAGAVRKLTFFLPRSWSGTLATAISLTLAFIPQILDEAATVRDAAYSRGLGARRSILRRAVSLGLPIAEATIRRADLSSEALLSRCYTDTPTTPDIHIRPFDIPVTLAVILPPLLLSTLLALR